MQKPKLKNINKKKNSDIAGKKSAKGGIDFEKAYKALIRGYIRIYTSSEAIGKEKVKYQKRSGEEK